MPRTKPAGRDDPGGTPPPANAEPSLLAAVMGLLEADGWTFTQAPGQPVLQIGFRGQNGTWNAYAQAVDDRGQFVFYSVSPLNAPEALRPAVLDFLNRANYDLAVGNFEMDPASGEIRLRTSLMAAPGPPDPSWLRPVIHLNLAVMDIYLPALMSVLWGAVTPAEAIARVESGV